GQIQLQATADADSPQLGHLQDGTIANLPVRHAGSEVTAATYGSLGSGSESVSVQMPDNALADTGAVKVIFSPTLLGGLDGAFITMRDNPYNNWEARLSRAVLASHYQALKEIIASAVRWEDAEQVIANALTQAGNFQASNGGMAFWSPRRDFVSQYLSVYTALAFGWLDKGGYTLPESVTEKLHAYLQEMLDREDKASLDKTLRAGVLAALASSSKAKVQAGEVADLVAQRHDLLLFG